MILQQASSINSLVNTSPLDPRTPGIVLGHLWTKCNEFEICHSTILSIRKNFLKCEPLYRPGYKSQYKDWLGKQKETNNAPKAHQQTSSDSSEGGQIDQSGQASHLEQEMEALARDRRLSNRPSPIGGESSSLSTSTDDDDSSSTSESEFYFQQPSLLQPTVSHF